jgi:mRNA-degrading endonuclease RelE of RelBE toxin-antitoxin system|tara:strand:+ start:4397 stop:4639 length:243 start_codon:yes stop_codon:yes gene_type:complete
MDKIEKALSKLNFKEKQKVKEILLQVNKGNFQNLNTKKLKGRDNIFRVRKSNIRIIFYKINNSIKVLTIERRGSKTYKKI